MKFQFLLEDLLTELSGKEIYQKYYSKINYDDFLNIVKSDPQSNVEDGEIRRMGKYSKLLLVMYQRGGLKLEDLDKAQEYLEYVYEHKVPLDMNKIKELGDLYNVVKGFIAKDAKTFQDVLRVLPTEEYDLKFNGKKWQIYTPFTEKASCYLGVNTEWCTTWGPYSLNKKHKDRGSMYQRYHGQGPLFILINKGNTDEKYQFHFESNQYMDKNDHRINTKEFLKQKDNSEILYYFFPSFFREASGEELEIEMKRIDLLPEEFGIQVFNKAIDNVNNPLVNALMTNNEKQLSMVFGDEYGIDKIRIEDGRIYFSFDTLSDDLEQLQSNISYYEYETRNGWEFIYDDMRDRGMDEYETERLQEFLKFYYSENNNRFKEVYGTKDFDEFLKTFYDNYVQNEQHDIKEAFWSDIADLSYSSYEEGNESIVEEIKKDINIENLGGVGGYEVDVNQVKFLKLLLKKNIKFIVDEAGLSSVLDDFIDFCGHSGDFERFYDYNIKYPKYGEKNNLTNSTNNYFDDILENVESNKECIELRKKLNDIVEKYFKNSTRYENDHIIVRLKSMDINCQTGMVKVEYMNKDTGEKFGGWNQKDGVKIDNLVSLLTNYKLFETTLKLTDLV